MIVNKIAITNMNPIINNGDFFFFFAYNLYTPIVNNNGSRLGKIALIISSTLTAAVSPPGGVITSGIDKLTNEAINAPTTISPKIVIVFVISSSFPDFDSS